MQIAEPCLQLSVSVKSMLAWDFKDYMSTLRFCSKTYQGSPLRLCSPYLELDVCYSLPCMAIRVPTLKILIYCLSKMPFKD